MPAMADRTPPATVGNSQERPLSTARMTISRTAKTGVESQARLERRKGRGDGRVGPRIDELRAEEQRQRQDGDERHEPCRERKRRCV